MCELPAHVEAEEEAEEEAVTRSERIEAAARYITTQFSPRIRYIGNMCTDYEISEYAMELLCAALAEPEPSTNEVLIPTKISTSPAEPETLEPYGWVVDDECEVNPRVCFDRVAAELESERRGCALIAIYHHPPGVAEDSLRKEVRQLADDAASFMYRVGFVAGTPDEELHRTLVALAGKHIADWQPNEYGDRGSKGKQPGVAEEDGGRA